MYKLIAAILLSLASLATLNVAVAGDDAPAGECTVICSLPVDLASAD